MGPKMDPECHYKWIPSKHVRIRVLVVKPWQNPQRVQYIAYIVQFNIWWSQTQGGWDRMKFTQKSEIATYLSNLLRIGDLIWTYMIKVPNRAIYELFSDWVSLFLFRMNWLSGSFAVVLFWIYLGQLREVSCWIQVAGWIIDQALNLVVRCVAIHRKAVREDKGVVVWFCVICHFNGVLHVTGMLRLIKGINSRLCKFWFVWSYEKSVRENERVWMLWIHGKIWVSPKNPVFLDLGIN